MAVINKTGITNGGTVQAEHVTRAIDALSGVSTDTIIATGSFSGSLTGIATSATSASYAVTASYATTASFALNSTTTFPFTGSARITGSLSVTGSFTTTAGTSSFQSTTINGFVGGNITGSSTLIMDLSTLGTGGNFVLPTTAPQNPMRGSIYFDFQAGTLYIHNGSDWLSTTLTQGG
jgi:hypothetical protein